MSDVGQQALTDFDMNGQLSLWQEHFEERLTFFPVVPVVKLIAFLHLAVLFLADTRYLQGFHLNSSQGRIGPIPDV